MTDWRMLFASPDIEVEGIRRHPDARGVVVTFDPLGADKTKRERLSESWLRDNGYDQIHVYAGGNNWFQSDHLDEACQHIEAVTRLYPDVTLFGFSMGAYAALMLSRRLAPSRVIAMAPQYSVDPAQIDWDWRWGHFTPSIRFRAGDMAEAIGHPIPKYVVYDPFEDFDRRHAERICAAPATYPVRVPFAGHFVGTYLRDIGALHDAMLTMLADKAPGMGIQRARRQHRRNQPGALLALALKLNGRQNIVGALTLIGRVYRRDPGAAGPIIISLQIWRWRQGAVGLAYLLHRWVKRIEPSWDIGDGQEADLCERLAQTPQRVAERPAMAALLDLLPRFDRDEWLADPVGVVAQHVGAMAGSSLLRPQAHALACLWRELAPGNATAEGWVTQLWAQIETEF